MDDALPTPIKNPNLVPHAWTENPTGHWFGRCDTCGRRRIHIDIYEVHGREGAGVSVWWRECSRCLIATLSWFNDLEKELERAAKETP